MWRQRIVGNRQKRGIGIVTLPKKDKAILHPSEIICLVFTLCQNKTKFRQIRLYIVVNTIRNHRREKYVTKTAVITTNSENMTFIA